MSELTKVKGIGPARVAGLAEMGIMTLADLARAKPDDLTRLRAVNLDRAAAFCAEAKAYLQVTAKTPSAPQRTTAAPVEQKPTVTTPRNLARAKKKVNEPSASPDAMKTANASKHTELKQEVTKRKAKLEKAKAKLRKAEKALKASVKKEARKTKNRR